MAIGEEAGPGPKRKVGREEKTLLIICWQEGLTAIREEAGPGLERELEREEKTSSIICWRVLSLFFMRFRHCFLFLSYLALAFLSSSSISSSLEAASIISSLRLSPKSRLVDLPFTLIFSKYNN